MNDYNRIKLPTKTIFNRDKLYQTENYLLLINSNGFNEVYKRLYFKDIQSVHIRKTNAWVTKAVSYWLLFGFFAIITVFAFMWTEDVSLGLYAFYLIAFFLPTILFLYLGIMVIAAGQSCVCTIHTAVQRLRVNAIQTLKHADVMLELIDRGVELNQDVMDRETIIEQIKNPQAAPEPEPQTSKPAPRRLKPARKTDDEPTISIEKRMSPVSSNDSLEETIDEATISPLEETVSESSPPPLPDDLEETIAPEDDINLNINSKENDTDNL